MGTQTKKIAVVLAGAVAKGAFEAGVIRALANADVQIVRIIASSSGALNGTLLAASVRNRDVRAGAEVLHGLWRNHAAWSEVFHLSLGDLLARDGMSDQQKLRALMAGQLQPSSPPDPADINLRIVVAPVNGVPGKIGLAAATTYESIREFDTAAFATQAGLDAVFDAATASAAFPGVFAPVEVDGIGRCVDGGTVNNTPMKWALDGEIGASIDAVVVVATSVAERAAPAGELGGVALIGHLAEMLIDERLYRDLREAAQVNEALKQLADLVPQGVLDAAQLDRVMAALSWSGRRTVDMIQIRPTEPLRGTAFSGFFHKDIRGEHLDAGFRRGQDVLRALGWSA